MAEQSMQLWGAVSIFTNEFEIALPASPTTVKWHQSFFIRADSPPDAINIGIEVDDVVRNGSGQSNAQLPVVHQHRRVVRIAPCHGSRLITVRWTDQME
jgi:hypothetical protein